MKKKLHSQKGFSLVEMLAATMVLVLLVLILNVGLNLSVKSYRTITAESETQLLLSSVTNVLSDELRYARDIVTKPETTENTEGLNGNLDRFLSVSYGRNTTLSLEDGQLYANGKRMLAAGAYGNGAYQIERLKITYDEQAETFALEIVVSGADDITAETALSVRPLNAIGGGKTE